ncbi:MAG: ABC transporter substrate-binding protein [Beijerinckiaceae bacterium]
MREIRRVGATSNLPAWRSNTGGKKRLSALAASALILAAAATGASASEIRIGITLADDIYLAPILAAEKLGLFKKAGIEVKRSPIRGIEVGIEALRANQVDMIDAPGPAVALASEKGLPGKIVVTSASGFFGWTVIVNKQSGYNALADLSGKKAGIATGRSLASMAAFLAMERGQIKFDVDAVGAGSLMPMLRQNEIQAAIGPAMLGLREVAGDRARIVYDLSLGQQRYTVSTLIATSEFIEKRPADLRAFLGAVAAALAHMQQNRKWSIDLLKEHANLVNTALVERMHDNIIRRMTPGEATDAKALKASMDLAARAWNLPEIANVDPGSLFTNDFLAPAQ